MSTHTSFYCRIGKALCMGLPLFLSLISTGCTSFGGRDASEPSAVQPTRTQLLMLNRAESSGWVGYTDRAMLNPPKEDYRVLVIRQKTGDILYDSIVPLPVNLRTHGFEMEPGDPRLQGLARQVDRNIIVPMEQYQRRSLDGDLPEDDPSSSEMEPSTEPTVLTPAPEPIMEEPPAEAPEAPEGVPALVEGPNSSLTGIAVLATTKNSLTLDVEPAGMLQKGDRLYLRHPPKTIVLPGMENNILTPGEVAGLVEVRQVEDGTVTAKLLSGDIPAEMYFERAETP